jgi:ACDE family multidrug resistance protein
VHAPFWFGAASVLVGVVILTAGARTVARTTRDTHVSEEQEAEAVLVGDLD